MICYMPFTYIEEKIVLKFAEIPGPVAICGLIPEAVPDHMRSWAQKKVLDLWYPSGVRTDQLRRAMEEFRAWADLHRGNITDMVGFHKLHQGHPPLVDDTQPTRIGDQIRHFGEHTQKKDKDPVFQAALFLSMAQEYDRQQDALARDMGTVLAMEQAMLARLSGDGHDIAESISETETPKTRLRPLDAGAYMTRERVQAWARLAGIENRPYKAFLTTSPAACAHMLEMFPETRGGLALKPGGPAEGAEADCGIRLNDALEALSLADDPFKSIPGLISINQVRGDTMAELTLFPLAGVSRHQFLDRLSGAGSAGEQPPAPDQSAVNTIVALLNIA